ncbi:unnamed protein product, partial [Diplocarpon coronariae]
LKAETETCMRLLGVDRVSNLSAKHASSQRKPTPGKTNI